MVLVDKNLHVVLGVIVNLFNGKIMFEYVGMDKIKSLFFRRELIHGIAVCYVDHGVSPLRLRRNLF